PGRAGGSRMASEQSFLEAIRADPDDDAVRLIFADWLEEQDDPARNARGEVIRVQLELERLPDDDPRRPDLVCRERGLLDRHREDWLGPGARLLRGRCDFARGLRERVCCDAADFLEAADDLFRLGPIRHVQLTNARELLPAVTECPHLAQVRTLDLGY